MSVRVKPWQTFLALAVALLALEGWVATRPDFAAQPEVLGLAVTADITLGIPLLFYLLVVRRHHVTPLALAPVFVLCLLAANALIPPAGQGALRLVEVVLPLVELMILAAAAFKVRGIVRAYRRLRPQAVYGQDALDAALRQELGDAWVIPLLTTELTLVTLAVAGWFMSFRPRPSVEAAFSTQRRSGYGLILGFILFILALETFGLHLVVSRWSTTAAWVLTFASLYTLIWLVGDFHAVRLQPIVLTAEALHVRCGLRWRATLPWAIIELARKATTQDKHRQDTLNAAVMGEPRLLLVCREPVVAVGLLGRRRHVRQIGLTIDDEKAFLESLRQHGVEVITVNRGSKK